ncbi:unnamed protein product [Rhizophagus irregularis]|nr:unnamed protein product [Rhizophagus irregularis]
MRLNFIAKKIETKLTWEDKYKLSYQLICGISYLHDEEIIHRNLHSNNVLINQNIIKLADFGLSKRIKEASERDLDLFDTVPYVDPKKFVIFTLNVGMVNQTIGQL